MELSFIVGGGTDASLVHMYCNNPDDEPIQDRFREVKSRGRYLTLYFFTDSSIERKGFRLEYSFSSFEDGSSFYINNYSAEFFIQIFLFVNYFCRMWVYDKPYDRYSDKPKKSTRLSQSCVLFVGYFGTVRLSHSIIFPSF